jgi:Ni,Fe-hydrogenase III component G
MSAEEVIAQSLIEQFDFLAGKIRIARARRIFLEVEPVNFARVFEFAVNKINFSILCSITGLDEQDRLSCICHLASPSGITLNIKTGVPKAEPVINTVTQFFPSAEVYERELADLFGFKVNGLAAGSRYPLPDDWPEGEFPLRKDWQAHQEDRKGAG